MGIFEKLFPARPSKQVNGYFKMLNGYSPVFTTWDGGVYEMELTRACIHTFATHCSKLQPAVSGADSAGIRKVLQNRVNPWMTTSQFLYRTATLLEARNTCYIVPIYSSEFAIIGYYPIDPNITEVIDVGGEAWLRCSFSNGQKAAMPFSEIGMLTKMQYKSDFKGEDNRALQPTMQLINMQNQGISEGIKNAASFRFMANVNNFMDDKDLAEERKRFTEQNFSAEGAGGMLLFPNSYSNVKQIESVANIVDAKQMELINSRVYTYFGSNEKVLQNSATGDDWTPYYEGKIEPFAIQLSEVMTAMSYPGTQLSRGNGIVWSSNRLQFMTNKDKLEGGAQMFDRAVFSMNDVLDLWNLPHVEGGDRRFIRRDYIDIDEIKKTPLAPEPEPKEPEPEPEPKE